MEPKQSYKKKKTTLISCQNSVEFLCMCVYWIRAFLDGGFARATWTQLLALCSRILRFLPRTRTPRYQSRSLECCLLLSIAGCWFQCCPWRWKRSSKSINQLNDEILWCGKANVLHAPIAFAVVMSIFKDILELNSCEFGNVVKVNIYLLRWESLRKLTLALWNMCKLFSTLCAGQQQMIVSKYVCVKCD